MVERRRPATRPDPAGKRQARHKIADYAGNADVAWLSNWFKNSGLDVQNLPGTFHLRTGFRGTSKRLLDWRKDAQFLVGHIQKAESKAKKPLNFLDIFHHPYPLPLRNAHPSRVNAIKALYAMSGRPTEALLFPNGTIRTLDIKSPDRIDSREAKGLLESLLKQLRESGNFGKASLFETHKPVSTRSRGQLRDALRGIVKERTGITHFPAHATSLHSRHFGAWFRGEKMEEPDLHRSQKRNTDGVHEIVRAAIENGYMNPANMFDFRGKTDKDVVRTAYEAATGLDPDAAVFHRPGIHGRPDQLTESQLQTLRQEVLQELKSRKFNELSLVRDAARPAAKAKPVPRNHFEGFEDIPPMAARMHDPEQLREKIVHHAREADLPPEKAEALAGKIISRYRALQDLHVTETVPQFERIRTKYPKMENESIKRKTTVSPSAARYEKHLAEEMAATDAPASVPPEHIQMMQRVDEALARALGRRREGP